ncbi:hypothetical protein BJX70DRAFT_388656 [Aspergillus crustosus]
MTPEEEQHQDKRTISMVSQFSQLSTQSTVSEFLESKIEKLETEMDFIRTLKQSLDEKVSDNLLTSEEFVTHLEPYLRSFRETSQELGFIKRQQRGFEDDLEQQVDLKRQRISEPDDGLLQRAYASTITARVIAMKAKQASSKFNTTRFRQAVEEYYGTAHPDNYHKSSQKYTWCHIRGEYLPSKAVKAAHLVPKSLSKPETSHLFGVDNFSRYDPLLGLTMYSVLEDRLDKGELIIVPMPGGLGPPTRWKCVVLDDTKLRDEVWKTFDGKKANSVKLGDMDGRQLQFLSDNRPARRFLYFRFIISYLNAKQLGIKTIETKVDTKKFWPIMGPYLRKSTLVTLARCVSGCELPAELVEGKTFETGGKTEIIAGEDAGMTLGLDLREALIESMKEFEDTAESED